MTSVENLLSNGILLLANQRVPFGGVVEDIKHRYKVYKVTTVFDVMLVFSSSFVTLKCTRLIYWTG